MRKILLALIVVATSSIHLFSQNTDETVDPNLNAEVFTVVDEMPEFPGGDEAYYEFLSKNMVYPAMAKEQEIQGRVWVGFTVQKDGSITDVKIIRGIGGGCDEEVVRVMKLMPKWKPGKQAGKEVICTFRMPVNFTLR